MPKSPFPKGAFISGAGSDEMYDGTALSQKAVIVVTFNYRLGVLGFLAHPLLSAKSPDHVSGNYGLPDQVAAFGEYSATSPGSAAIPRR